MSELRWTYSYVSYDADERFSFDFFFSKEEAEAAAKASTWNYTRVFQVRIAELGLEDE